MKVRTEYLEVTLGLVKHLEISKEMLHECVTVPGCCCMPLLHDHLMDSCSYTRKNTLLAAKGGCINLNPSSPQIRHCQWIDMQECICTAVFTRCMKYKLYSLRHTDIQIIPRKPKSMIKFKVRKVVWCIPSEFGLTSYSGPSYTKVYNSPNKWPLLYASIRILIFPEQIYTTILCTTVHQVFISAWTSRLRMCY